MSQADIARFRRRCAQFRWLAVFMVVTVGGRTPRLGKWISGASNDAYNYLPDSVMKFPERSEFTQLMADAGLRSPRFSVLSGGIAAVYRGEVQG